MRTKILSTVALSFGVLSLGIGVSPKASADVTVEEETKMGGVMKIVTFGRGMKTKTFISGDRMRTESGDDVQIVDVSAETIYDLNEKKKTYTATSFEEMRQQLEAAMNMATAEGSKAGAEGGEEPELTTSASVSVTETGRSEEIKGFDTKQYLMELDVTVTSEEEQESGTLSTVTEIWLAKDVPGFGEMQAFYRKMAEKLGTTHLGRQTMAAADESETRTFGQGMQRMADEMKKLDGFALRSVFYFGSPEAAKREASGEKKEGGGLGGMFKKMKPFGNEEAAENDADGQQAEGAVMMKFETEVKKIETKSLEQDLFRVPESYELVTEP